MKRTHDVAVLEEELEVSHGTGSSSVVRVNVELAVDKYIGLPLWPERDLLINVHRGCEQCYKRYNVRFN